MNATDGYILYYALNDYGVTVPYFIINIITVLTGLMIMFLNFLVVDTLRKKPELTNTADVILVSLGISDFVTGILVLYVAAYNLTNFQNAVECRCRFGFILTMGICSGFHLLILTIDRFIKIMKPLDYTKLCHRCSFLTTCISMWVFAVLVGLVPTFGWKNLEEETDGDELLCSFFGTLHYDYLRLAVVLFLTPAILMLILYGLIFRVAYKHSRQIMALEQVTNHHTSHKLSWKFTKTISIIVGIYVLMWVPTGIYVVCVILGSMDHWTDSEKGEILTYTAGIAYLNSLLDPIIYAFQISSVKRRFRAVFCCRKDMVQDTTLLTDFTAAKGRPQMITTLT